MVIEQTQVEDQYEIQDGRNATSLLAQVAEQIPDNAPSYMFPLMEALMEMVEQDKRGTTTQFMIEYAKDMNSLRRNGLEEPFKMVLLPTGEDPCSPPHNFPRLINVVDLLDIEDDMANQYLKAYQKPFAPECTRMDKVRLLAECIGASRCNIIWDSDPIAKISDVSPLLASGICGRHKEFNQSNLPVAAPVKTTRAPVKTAPPPQRKPISYEQNMQNDFEEEEFIEEEEEEMEEMDQQQFHQQEQQQQQFGNGRGGRTSAPPSRGMFRGAAAPTSMSRGGMSQGRGGSMMSRGGMSQGRSQGGGMNQFQQQQQYDGGNNGYGFRGGRGGGSLMQRGGMSAPRGMFRGGRH